MAKEIERKFLVDGDEWKDEAERGVRFTQAYLFGGPARSARVRILNDRSARLTMKFGAGLSRDEYEYDIPVEDARELVGHAEGVVIDKTRYRVPHRGFVYEVDVFHGAHAGLILAEVELPDEHAEPSLPAWLGREVTGDRRYINQSLAETGGLPEETR
ncbi:CYTH domain-containing protein [Martelella endophytica]|uniref:Adenylate cyclase n=1 Tax=Martelella endophytica TaxID=1486262 RepID=A0A0D5LKM5_MAREN|nr:CYTH domain-containing protein [Martelella endophytica]AJY44711.1 adenylate cyclase [Martelella endophytica]